MAVQWAGSSPELLVQLDRKEPLGVQLQSALREAIRTGRLSHCERLPSSRSLAAQLGISRGVVQEAFDQLRAEGYLTSKAGSATRVAHVPAAAAPPPELPSASSARPLLADFRAGVPDLGGFPRADWVWAHREVAKTARTGDLGYGDPAGAMELREVLAAYLRGYAGRLPTRRTW